MKAGEFTSVRQAARASVAYLTAMPGSRCISGEHASVDVDLMADEAAIRVRLTGGECPHCPGQRLVPRLKPSAEGLEDFSYCECCGSWWKQWKQPPEQAREPGTMDRSIRMAPGLRTLDTDGKQGRHRPPVI